MTAPPASSTALTTAYVAELRRAARDLPKARRLELLDQIQEHLRDAVAVDASETATRTALDRLGEPGQIVAEELERLGITPAAGGAFEWITIVLSSLADSSSRSSAG